MKKYAPNLKEIGLNFIPNDDKELWAENDTKDGTEETLVSRSTRGINLFAGLSLADQAALAMEATAEHGRDPTGRRTIDFEVTSERELRFLNMAAGQEAVVHVTCLGTDGEWQRLKVRKVIWGR